MLSLVQLAAGAVIAHELLAFGVEGRNYVRRCFLPVLGLQFPPSALLALHGSLIVVSALVIIAPESIYLSGALWALVTLLIASYSLRLPNHLVILWFQLALAVTAEAQHLQDSDRAIYTRTGALALLSLAYALSCVHKLNRDFLTPSRSCGYGLAQLYFVDRGLRGAVLKHWYALAGIFGVIGVEASLPLLLLTPRTYAVGLVIAFLLHLQFGLLCHVHFSTVMYGLLLTSALPLQATHGDYHIAWPAVSAGAVLGLLVGLRLGVTSIFASRRYGLFLQMTFGAVSGLVASLIVAAFMSHHPLAAPLRIMSLPRSSIVCLCVLIAGFLANGLSPYLGLKTEYSLAMFSNLRSRPWNHLLMRDNRRLAERDRRVIVRHISGLPDIAHCGAQWASGVAVACLQNHARLSYSSYFFHEALKAICREVTPRPHISVDFTENGRHEACTDYALEWGSRRAHYRRLVLFPFREPLNPEDPYCS